MALSNALRGTAQPRANNSTSLKVPFIPLKINQKPQQLYKLGTTTPLPAAARDEQNHIMPNAIHDSDLAHTAPHTAPTNPCSEHHCHRAPFPSARTNSNKAALHREHCNAVQPIVWC